MMHRELTVSGAFTYGAGKPIPALKLQGIWLQSLGYKVGSKVSITAKDGAILIRLLEK